jgi:uncharacterized surface protein with fasciclin (FAS1) repeats
VNYKGSCDGNDDRISRSCCIRVFCQEIENVRTFAWALLATMGLTGMVRGQSDIVDTAVGAGSFKTLATALQAAGLVDTLKGPGPFTVFAPTDEAFAKLPAGTVEDLLKPENRSKLTSILTYHVVPGKVMAGDVVKLNGQDVKTVEGSPARVTVSGDKVMIANANVVKTDIECTNGVIHVIDSVILPPEKPAPVGVSAGAPAEVHSAPAYHAPAMAYPAPAPVYHAPAMIRGYAAPAYHAPARGGWMNRGWGWGRSGWGRSSCGR